MIKDFIKKLAELLKIDFPIEGKDKSFLIEINDELSFKIFIFEDIAYLSAIIDSVPIEKKEEVFMYLMRANLLGQGTFESRIGMENDEKVFTLTYQLPSIENFNEFKEKIEDFVISSF